MNFRPEKYRIEDKPNIPFINNEEIFDILKNVVPDKIMIRDVVQKSLSKQRLSLSEVAVLLNTRDKEHIDIIKEGASELKEKVYGKRIVLFAPLYVGNLCSNDCQYCGFRMSNKFQERVTLTDTQLEKEIRALENTGQKRLILVFGEHPKYTPDFIADTVKKVYGIKENRGEIRRVNINAAPFGVEGFRKVREAGIGTYQVFQETYHKGTYLNYHKSGNKSHYENRLTALDRAFEAGIDDVGIGALFGLYNWKYEIMGLIRHVNHLEACFNVGPHTISFPRLQEASGVNIDPKYLVSDDDLTTLIAILRLAVPYTGLILTARENVSLRNKAIKYGVSQIDGGTKLELGSYSETHTQEQNLNNEQFKINDERSLAEIMEELVEKEQLPSFCTACYRMGRTGEHFLEFSVPGFIKRFCTPNALFTLAEYLEDYASPGVSEKGWNLIYKNLEKIKNTTNYERVSSVLARIKEGERDIYF